MKTREPGGDFPVEMKPKRFLGEGCGFMRRLVTGGSHEDPSRARPRQALGLQRWMVRAGQSSWKHMVHSISSCSSCHRALGPEPGAGLRGRVKAGSDLRNSGFHKGHGRPKNHRDEKLGGRPAVEIASWPPVSPSATCPAHSPQLGAP